MPRSGTFILRPTILAQGGSKFYVENYYVGMLNQPSPTATPSPDYAGWGVIVNNQLPSQNNTIIKAITATTAVASNNLQAGCWVAILPYPRVLNDTLRFVFANECFYLDGSNTPISFATLPAGFTIASAILSLGVPNTPATIVNYTNIIAGSYNNVVLAIPNGIDTYAINFYLQQDNVTEGSANATSFPYDLSSSLSNTIDIYSGGCGLRVAIDIQLTNTDSGLVIANIFNLMIYGTYVIAGSGTPLLDLNQTNQTWTLQNQIPVTTGSLINLTSNNNSLAGITTAYLQIGTQSYPVILVNNTGNLLSFYIPSTIGNYQGQATVIGTTFSGSVALGVLTILYSDASGIYTLVQGATNDTIYLRYTESNTIFYQWLLEDNDLDEDFFDMMTYPRRALATTDEPDEADPNQIIEYTPVYEPYQVPIPNPFIETAYI